MVSGPYHHYRLWDTNLYVKQVLYTDDQLLPPQKTQQQQQQTNKTKKPTKQQQQLKKNAGIYKEISPSSVSLEVKNAYIHSNISKKKIQNRFTIARYIKARSWRILQLRLRYQNPMDCPYH